MPIIDASSTYKPLLSRRTGFLGNDRFTKLLLHGDGADAATTTLDSSRSGHVVTFEGNTQLDTAQKKFGSASILFDGNNDYVSIADSLDWFMDSGLFEIDFWVRFKSMKTTGFISQRVNEDNSVDLFLVYASPESQDLYFTIKTGGVTTVQIMHSNPNFVVDQWYHISLIRGFLDNADRWNISINGTSNFGSTDSDVWPNLAAPLIIGSALGAPVTYSLDGWIDEFRVSKGIARRIESYTPWTIPYR